LKRDAALPQEQALFFGRGPTDFAGAGRLAESDDLFSLFVDRHFQTVDLD